MAVHGYLSRILPALLDARRVRDNPGLSWEEVSRLSDGIRRLSAGFTGSRDLPGEKYFAKADLLDAYLLYYFPITYAKVAQVLAELTVTSPAPRALDLGSGPGPAALALGHRLGAHSTIVAADRDVPCLGALRGIWKHAGVGQLHTFAWEAPAALPKTATQFDLIVAANLLNELFIGRRQRMDELFAWLRSVASRLSQSGSLVLLEPALRETGRDLLDLRDRAVTAGWFVHAPCFWQGPCPALEKDRDWCHASKVWQPPEWVRVLGEEAGISPSKIGFSYVVLGRHRPAPAPTGVARVVSDPLVESGKKKLWVCGDMGRRLATRLDKLASGKNADLDRAERGDVVVIEGARPLPEELRLDGDSDLRLMRRVEPEDLPLPKTEILVRRD
jgi:ribosomal protein RSM22 (predicted rRNA methylase)